MMIEVVWEDKKGESLTLTRLINGLWRCPSIDVNARSRDCHATDALRAISVWKLKLKTKWVCIQLACSWRPRAFEEAHRWNIQAKFYNEKFPLVYESDKIGDSLSWRSWCYFEAQVWKKDSNIVPSLFFSHHFICLGLLFFCGLFFSSGVSSRLMGESSSPSSFSSLWTML